jgi:hypothetical protein
MALRVARGLFRLWLVLSVLWIGGVGVVMWRTFPEKYVSPVQQGQGEGQPAKPRSDEFDPDEYLAFKAAEERRSAIFHASLLAFLPPAFLFALGSALVWAFRGFR